MKNQPNSRSNKGFTLIELLVVIAIIIILAAAGFGVGGSAIKSAQKKVAKNDCVGLVIAVDGYYDEYQRLPGVPGAADYETETDNRFMDILLGFDEEENPKTIRFYSGKEAKGDKPNTAVGGLLYGNKTAELFDPFRRDGDTRNDHYHVLLDGNYDEELKDPAGSDTLYGKRALIWSTGVDNKLGTGSGDGTKDNVYSWK